MIAFFFWASLAFIIYVYFGYPILLTIFARLKPRGMSLASDDFPFITILIAAYNEQDVIAQKIENTLDMDYPRDKVQILVTADGSDDETSEIVKAFASKGVGLLYEPERNGKMHAIDRAMPHVRGDIIVFSDANNMFMPETVKNLIAPFADKKVGGVTGAKHIVKGDGALGESEGLYWRYESFIKKQETCLGSCTGVAGELFSIRKALYVRPPMGVINDDFYMAMQILKQNKRLVYVPSAKSYERISLSARDEIRRRARIIAGRYQALSFAHRYLSLRRPLIVWQVVSHKFMRPFVPVAMLFILLTGLLSVVIPAPAPTSLRRLSAPYNYLLFAGQLLVYLLAWAGSQLGAGSKLKKILYIPTFLVNSNYAALVGLYRFLNGKQSVTWERVQRRTTNDKGNLSS